MKKTVNKLSAVILSLLLMAGCGAIQPNTDASVSSSTGSVEEQSKSSSQTEVQSSSADETVANPNTSTVYMTTDITSEGLMAIYAALGHELNGNTAIKLHMGEPGGNNYLKPDLVKDLVQSVNGAIVDSNTAYGGQRASTALHLQVAEDHGFAAIAAIDILDADGDLEIPVEGGVNLTSNKVGSHLENYDSMLVLTHFKGHAMGGFGGAMKNISIGIASVAGKGRIHTGNESTVWQGDQDRFLESMAEAAMSVDNYFGDEILYINVLNNISVDCDCSPNPAAPDMHDIGILASTDPVALDQASIDLIYTAADGGSVVARIESRNGLHIFDHTETLGFGNRAYELVNIDA